MSTSSYSKLPEVSLSYLCGECGTSENCAHWLVRQKRSKDTAKETWTSKLYAYIDPDPFVEYELWCLACDAKQEQPPITTHVFTSASKNSKDRRVYCADKKHSILFHPSSDTLASLKEAVAKAKVAATAAASAPEQYVASDKFCCGICLVTCASKCSHWYVSECGNKYKVWCLRCDPQRSNAGVNIDLSKEECKIYKCASPLFAHFGSLYIGIKSLPAGHALLMKPSTKDCKACRGGGKIQCATFQLCPACAGVGKVYCVCMHNCACSKEAQPCKLCLGRAIIPESVIKIFKCPHCM